MRRLIFERLTDPVDPLPIAKTDTDRVREHLVSNGYSLAQASDLIRGYDLVSIVRRQLGIKE